jgi:hypothetical protein
VHFLPEETTAHAVIECTGNCGASIMRSGNDEGLLIKDIIDIWNSRNN